MDSKEQISPMWLFDRLIDAEDEMKRLELVNLCIQYVIDNERTISVFQAESMIPHLTENLRARSSSLVKCSIILIIRFIERYRFHFRGLLSLVLPAVVENFVRNDLVLRSTCQDYILAVFRLFQRPALISDVLEEHIIPLLDDDNPNVRGEALNCLRITNSRFREVTFEDAWEAIILSFTDPCGFVAIASKDCMIELYKSCGAPFRREIEKYQHYFDVMRHKLLFDLLDAHLEQNVIPHVDESNIKPKTQIAEFPGYLLERNEEEFVLEAHDPNVPQLKSEELSRPFTLTIRTRKDRIAQLKRCKSGSKTPRFNALTRNVPHTSLKVSKSEPSSDPSSFLPGPSRASVPIDFFRPRGTTDPNSKVSQSSSLGQSDATDPVNEENQSSSLSSSSLFKTFLPHLSSIRRSSSLLLGSRGLLSDPTSLIPGKSSLAQDQYYGLPSAPSSVDSTASSLSLLSLTGPNDATGSKTVADQSSSLGLSGTTGPVDVDSYRSSLGPSSLFKTSIPKLSRIPQPSTLLPGSGGLLSDPTSLIPGKSSLSQDQQCRLASSVGSTASSTSIPSLSPSCAELSKYFVDPSNLFMKANTSESASSCRSLLSSPALSKDDDDESAQPSETHSQSEGNLSEEDLAQYKAIYEFATSTDANNRTEEEKVYIDHMKRLLFKDKSTQTKSIFKLIEDLEKEGYLEKYLKKQYRNKCVQELIMSRMTSK